MKNLFKRSISLVLSFTLMGTYVIAEEDVVSSDTEQIERYLLSDLKEMAEDHNASVMALYAQYLYVNRTYEDYKDTMGNYKSVYKKFNTFKELLEAEEDGDLTFMESYELDAYKKIYRGLGINTKNINDEDEYETFIEPIYITTNTLKENVESLENGMNTTKVSVSSGVAQLYKGLINAETYYNIQLKVIQQNENDLEILREKYDHGLVAKNEITKAENDLEIAKLEGEQLYRQVDSLKMNLNYMIGEEITEDTKIVTEISRLYNLNEFESYLEGALENRIEITSLDDSIATKDKEVELIDKFYIRTNSKYIIAEMELNQLIQEREIAVIDIEKELTLAYEDVVNKQEEVSVAKLEYDDILRQYDELYMNYELGNVTENDLLSFEILVLQYEVNYTNTVLDHNQAILDLQNAANLGPAYEY